MIYLILLLILFIYCSMRLSHNISILEERERNTLK